MDFIGAVGWYWWVSIMLFVVGIVVWYCGVGWCVRYVESLVLVINWLVDGESVVVGEIVRRWVVLGDV